MRSSSDNPSKEDFQKLGVIGRENAVAARQILIDESTNAFRWVMASLLALNGGGLIAAKDVIRGSDPVGWFAVLAFYLGLATALLIAWSMQNSVRAAILPLQEAIGLWTRMELIGPLTAEQQERLHFILGAPQTMSKTPRRAGYGSFFSFSAGLALLASSAHLGGATDKTARQNVVKASAEPTTKR